jgi:hypothetical protein
VVFSDDIGMAAAHSAGGTKARVEAHLDAGCDVVLVCHPQMVEDALHALEGRKSNTMALIGLIGRGALGWDGLLADNRHGEAKARMASVPVAAQDAGATVLLVDDILDEGHTLKAIRDFCLEQGAARVLLVVLCEKRHGRGAGLKADFVGVEVPDRYVFGFGMDYHEQGRNLAAIYAVDA